MYSLAGIAADINPNYHNYFRLVLTKALLIAADIKSICRPQQPFLGRSNESSIIYVRTQLAIATNLRNTTVRKIKRFTQTQQQNNQRIFCKKVSTNESKQELQPATGKASGRRALQPTQAGSKDPQKRSANS